MLSAGKEKKTTKDAQVLSKIEVYACSNCGVITPGRFYLKAGVCKTDLYNKKCLCAKCFELKRREKDVQKNNRL